MADTLLALPLGLLAGLVVLLLFELRVQRAQPSKMNQTVQFFLSLESAAFIVAGLVHFGFLANGYEHTRAGIAETVIGTVLALGFIVLLLRPRLTRLTGLVVQGFAFLGTLVGGFTIIIGVGPRTVPDVLYHAAIATLLACGLMVTWRGRSVNLIETRSRQSNANTTTARIDNPKKGA